MSEIIFAQQEKIDSSELEPYVSSILEALEHAEAFVTDESTISDFCSFSDLIEQKYIRKIRHRFGITVTPQNTIVSIAERLRSIAINM